jgi:uncharacterized protein with HEPN domain
MKAPRRDDYLRHMREALGLAQAHVASMDEGAFMADPKTQQAVVFNLIVLGEAATKLAAQDPDWVSAHPTIPWAALRGMRNRLAHGYFDINWRLVWDTVQRDFPVLQRALDAAVDP